jgi:transcriptional regulator with XRE-family HTH domain
MSLGTIGGGELLIGTLPSHYMPADKADFSPSAIGSRLAVTRTVVGLNQVEFAKKAKIAPNTYNQFEQGKKRPSLANAIRLCDAYDLTLDWIYVGDPSGLRYEMADAIKAIRNARH